MKIAKRSGKKVQHEKLKDWAKYIAAIEASKKNGKGKGKVDEDEPLPGVPKKWKDYSVEFHFPEPIELTPPLLQLIEISYRIHLESPYFATTKNFLHKVQ